MAFHKSGWGSHWLAPGGGVALPPPQPTFTPLFTDNFNRANGTLAGSNGWAATSDGSATILSNEVSGVGSSVAADYRTLETYGNDQYAKATVGTVPNIATDFVGLLLRHNASTNAEYEFLWIPGNIEFYYRTAPGNYNALFPVAASLTTGQVIQFMIIGNVLVGYVDGVPKLTIIDNTIPSGGVPGLTTFGTMTMDNFECGNASMGTPLGAAIGSDNFNRANGNASAGQAMWTPITATFSGVVSADGVIVSNELNVSDTNHHTAYRNETYNADQWATIQVGSVPPSQGGSAFVGVILRWNGSTAYLVCYFLSSNSINIYTIQAGSSSTLLASTPINPATGAVPTGGSITGVARGSRISGRVNGVEVVSVTDTTRTSGAPGYQIFPTTTADNFSAGNV